MSFLRVPQGLASPIHHIAIFNNETPLSVPYQLIRTNRATCFIFSDERTMITARFRPSANMDVFTTSSLTP